jgi:hypothetical protein
MEKGEHGVYLPGDIRAGNRLMAGITVSGALRKRSSGKISRQENPCIYPPNPLILLKQNFSVPQARPICQQTLNRFGTSILAEIAPFLLDTEHAGQISRDFGAAKRRGFREKYYG